MCLSPLLSTSNAPGGVNTYTWEGEAPAEPQLFEQAQIEAPQSVAFPEKCKTEVLKRVLVPCQT
jgi:hypothetical protein